MKNASKEIKVLLETLGIDPRDVKFLSIDWENFGGRIKPNIKLEVETGS